MFDFIRIRRLDSKERALYDWFSNKRIEADVYWKNLKKKMLDQDYMLSHEAFREIRGKKIGKEKDMWKQKFAEFEHKEYGEIKDIYHFWTNTNQLLKVIMSSIAKKKLEVEMPWINNKIQFIKTAIREERRRLQKGVKKGFQKISPIEPVVHHGVLKDEAYFDFILKKNYEKDVMFLAILDWDWKLLEEIETKLKNS